MVDTINELPMPVVRRLSRYLTYLQVCDKKNIDWISSDQLADEFSLTSITVRRDISYLSNFSGVPKRGYKTRMLMDVLQKAFGSGQVTRMVVIGAGSLGYLFSAQEDRVKQQFEICGVFDTNPEAVGKSIGRMTVQSLERFSHTIWDKKVDMGVVAVSEDRVQEVADLLVMAGVRGILNFTPVQILAPENVTVINAPILTSLLELLYLIQAR